MNPTDKQIAVEQITPEGPIIVTFGPEVPRNQNVRLELAPADAHRLLLALYEVLWKRRRTSLL